MAFWRALKRLFAPRSADADVQEAAPPASREAPAVPRQIAEPRLDRGEQVPVAQVRELVAEPVAEPVEEPEPEVFVASEPPQPEDEPAPAASFADAAVDAAVPESAEPSAEAPAEPAGVAVSTRPEATLVLQLESDPGPSGTFEVARAGATVGRGPENTIRLNDLSVTRRHAKISFRQGSFWLSDLGSTSGTWVDGARLNAPRALEAGQVIDVGVCRLTVTHLIEPERSTRASAVPARAGRPTKRRGS